MFDSLTELGFQIEFHSHARAILSVDFPDVASQLEQILVQATIPIEEIVGSGGGETKGTQRLRRALHNAGWRKHKFEVQKIIDGTPKESISHEVDHVLRFEAGVLALEIEWNNKDPFFDRDLENFKRLHADGAISLGVIVTRGATLQDGMRGRLERYARDHRITSVDDLRRIGLFPTRRQQTEYERRMGPRRPRRGQPSLPPLTFGEAWASAFVADKFGAATTHWRKLEDRVRRGVGNPCPLVLIGLPSQLVTFDEDADVIAALIEEGREVLPDGQPSAPDP